MPPAKALVPELHPAEVIHLKQFPSQEYHLELRIDQLTEEGLVGLVEIFSQRGETQIGSGLFPKGFDFLTLLVAEVGPDFASPKIRSTSPPINSDAIMPKSIS